MKSYILSIITFLALAFTSCTEPENKAEKVKPIKSYKTEMVLELLNPNSLDSIAIHEDFGKFSHSPVYIHQVSDSTYYFEFFPNNDKSDTLILSPTILSKWINKESNVWSENASVEFFEEEFIALGGHLESKIIHKVTIENINNVWNIKGYGRKGGKYAACYSGKFIMPSNLLDDLIAASK